jgi:hypothetical protein
LSRINHENFAYLTINDLIRQHDEAVVYCNACQQILSIELSEIVIDLFSGGSRLSVE